MSSSLRSSMASGLHPAGRVRTPLLAYCIYHVDFCQEHYVSSHPLLSPPCRDSDAAAACAICVVLQ